MNPLLRDRDTLDFLQRQASGARYVTSVCTGAPVLGATELRCGKRATTHWMSLPMLPAFGCEPVAERAVVDGNALVVNKNVDNKSVDCHHSSPFVCSSRLRRTA